MVRRANQLRVLVVDDDDMMVDLLAIELGRRGCEVRCALSGSDALSAMDEGFDLVLTDWHMPGMDGMELVRAARERHTRESHLHITMMTASRDVAARAAALDAGVDSFLYKPIDPIELDLALATARRNGMLERRLLRRNRLLGLAHERTRAALRAVREDVEAAAMLHRRLLPRADQLRGIRAAHLYEPAAGLGGDTIGASAVGEGQTLFFLIDVRGHGVPAALDSFHLHHRLKQVRPSTAEQLREAMDVLNAEIGARGDDCYATAIAGIIDAPGRQGWLVRAGHPPPVLQSGGSTSQLEDRGSLPLGLFDDADFAVRHFAFAPGDRLTLYSDGLAECLDRTGREIGGEGVAALLGSFGEAPLDALIPALLERIDSASRQDDVSLLALESPLVDSSVS